MWAQTPQFNVRIDDANNGDIELNVHHGIIKSFEVDAGYESEMHEGFRHALVGQKLQDINDWTAFLKSRVQNWDARCSSIAGRFDELMPVPAFPAR
jgi:lipoate-protein ligase A